MVAGGLGALGIRILSHVAEDMARSWFRACLTQTAHIQAIFGPFLGHFVELEGNKGPMATGLLGRTFSVATVCLHLSVLTGFLGRFGPKQTVVGQNRLFWGTKCAVLGGRVPTWRPRSGVPPVIFWLKTWIGQGHHLGSGMARVE